MAAPTVRNFFKPKSRPGAPITVADLAAYLAETEHLPAARLRELQLCQAGELIRYAQKMAPFYKDRLAPFTGKGGVPLGEQAFQSIPILTRRDVQSAGAALHSRIVPRGHGGVSVLHTSGSTGAPVRVRTTQLASLYPAAVSLRGHRWFGRDLAATNVSIKVVKGDETRRQLRGWAAGSTGPAFVYSNVVPVGQLFDWLIADDPHYLQCHPSTLQALIHRSREAGATPARLRDVRTMGEILAPALRDLCRREWGVPVRDNYSCEELATLAITCPDGDHLHIHDDRVLVEVLDNDGHPCAPGETGRVVATGLLNFATPLIRYELGDRAVAGAPCSCGRGLGVVERIIGRERNPLILPSGDRVFPVLDAEPLLLAGGVRQYQVIQTGAEEIELRLVADTPLAETAEAAITSQLQGNFGHPFRLTFAYVDEIPREPGGKYLLFKSALAT